MIHTDTAHTDTETYIVIGKRPIPIPCYNLYQYQADDHTDTHSQTTHDDNEYALKRGKGPYLKGVSSKVIMSYMNISIFFFEAIKKNSVKCDTQPLKGCDFTKKCS